MNHGFLLWGNSSHSVQIFKIQKNVIRFITGCRSGDSCRDLFKNQKILPLQSQYVLFVVNNENKFKLNSDMSHKYRNVTFTSLHQIYHYIKKESIQLA